MRSLQDYKNIYREIATNLELQGESVEMLVQMLANASYISEVENISYMQEASIEGATLVNSKIQHCMNEMYSVFRGQCPRVILRFKPTKYFSFNMFDLIVSSNNFNIYYLGYLSTDKYKPTKIYNTGDRVFYNGKYWESLKDNNQDVPSSSDAWLESDSPSVSKGAKSIAIEEGFEYGPTRVIPATEDEDTYVTIIGLLATSVAQKNWTLKKDNTYYVETTEENLSNDMYIAINGDYYDVTRNFSEHLVDHTVFDLTTTSFSSRLYVSDVLGDSMPTSSVISALYFKFSRLSNYNLSELKKIKISGAEMISFGEETWHGKTEIEDGIICLDEIGRDDISTIHYKAARDRFVNSILRSNSDVGTVLEEMYANKIISGGTNYEFDYTTENSDIVIYYVPRDSSNLLTTQEIQNFINTKKAYYVTDNIYVKPGSVYTAVFTVDVELFNAESINSEIFSILNQYSKKFKINLEEKLDEIKALIAKISNIKQIKEVSISYLAADGSEVRFNDIPTIYKNIDTTYFNIEYVINSSIRNN